MNELTQIQDTLPSLIDRAASALSGARSSAEVLEARDLARVAYDAAKSAGRLRKRQRPRMDEVLSAVFSRTGRRGHYRGPRPPRCGLADEYDAAQDRGEVMGSSRSCVGDDNAPPTTAELGLRRDEIHEARKLRDAERRRPARSRPLRMP